MFKEIDDDTELVADMQVTPRHKDFFEETWPKALDKIKALAQDMRAS